MRKIRSHSGELLKKEKGPEDCSIEASWPETGSPEHSATRLRDRRSGECFVCGSEGHRSFACPNRARLSKKEKDRKVTFNAEAVEQRQKRHKVDSDWNEYIKRREKDSDEESDEIHMMLSYSCGNFVEEVHMAEDDGYVFLDSCESKRLFIVKDQSVLESFVYSGGSIQTTRAGVQL